MLIPMVLAQYSPQYTVVSIVPVPLERVPVPVLATANYDTANAQSNIPLWYLEID